MKKRRLFLSILLLLPLTVVAQVKFGYLSHRTLCQEMPQYAQAQKEMLALKATYEQEALRGEEEFQRKFSDFLHGQKEFPANILQKRQAELQDLMDKGIKFRREAEQLLVDAEQQLLANLSKQLNEAIVAVGMEMGYSFILNTDDNACPFINSLLGDDVSNLVRKKLGIPEVVTEQHAEPTSPQQDASKDEQATPVAEDSPVSVPPVEAARPM